MNALELKKLFQESFDSAVVISKLDYFRQSNALKSAKFVSVFGEKVYTKFFSGTNSQLNTIRVNDLAVKTSGEWLLDISITESINKFKNKILLAVESESNTSIKAFNDDFAKLLHIEADNYIYLNGLDQSTKAGMDNYVYERLGFAGEILKNRDRKNFYLGFFASPKKYRNVPSIWDELPDGKFGHLNTVLLFQFIEGSFREI